MGTHIELIEFEIPKTPGTRLYVPKILWPSNYKAGLIHLLRKKFSPFGLVHFVHAQTSGSANESTICESATDDAIMDENSSLWYAYITYYAPSAGHKAQLFLNNNLIINGTVCRVLPARERTLESTLTVDAYSLPAHSCIELANYYLGFNGWSSQVVYNSWETADNDGLVCSQLFALGIRLTFHDECHHQISVEGVGLATAEYGVSENVEESGLVAKAKSMAFAQKSARNIAIQNAFSKIVIVIVDGQKVTARVNSIKADPFFYNPLWDEHKMVEVNEVDYRPINEDDVNEAEDRFLEPEFI